MIHSGERRVRTAYAKPGRRLIAPESQSVTAGLGRTGSSSSPGSSTGGGVSQASSHSRNAGAAHSSRPAAASTCSAGAPAG
eukprot:scaffold25533_cov36-Tisochrysis_lutea.AAC.1